MRRDLLLQVGEDRRVNLPLLGRIVTVFLLAVSARGNTEMTWKAGEERRPGPGGARRGQGQSDQSPSLLSSSISPLR